jgi:hypothetical protein
MARYRGTVQGTGGEASRCGGKSNGLRTSANSWKIGVDVHIYPQTDNQEADEVHITITSGSDYRGIRIPLPVITEKDLEDLRSGKKRICLEEVV